MKARVSQAQGGAYCRMCGRQDELHVDHITPTSRGGDERTSNLQLLCQSCNLGKGASLFGHLPSVLRVSTGKEITEGLRFLRLSLRSVEMAGRPLGRCDQGHLASESHLRVSRSELFAPHLTSLRVDCEHCLG